LPQVTGADPSRRAGPPIVKDGVPVAHSVLLSIADPKAKQERIPGGADLLVDA
jgi:hypothetical protein